MDISKYFGPLIGSPESHTLEYKATPVPSRSLAQIMAAFANSDGGGLLFGVREQPGRALLIEGISSDFQITTIFQKALALLQPRPVVFSDFFTWQGRQLYGIVVEKSKEPVMVEGQAYIRVGESTKAKVTMSETKGPFKFPKFTSFREFLDREQQKATSSKKRLLDHYSNILKVYEPVLDTYFPATIFENISAPEGKVFNRVLFSSCVDNFETYLSALLYEIYLARPETLKGGESTVKVAEVLDCADMEEFVQWYAAKRVGKLQKGSVEGFLSKNPEIATLGAIEKDEIKEIEKILQIRHLYTHRNGIIDESFLHHYRGQYQINEEHQLSLEQLLDKLEYLVGIVAAIDKKAVDKYGLSTQEPA